MTIPKAILNLEAILQYGNLRVSGDQEASVKLGIEALKGILKVRKTFRPYVEVLLPGETKD